MTTPANAKFFETFIEPGTEATICLYGNYHTGHGYIADAARGGMFGTGEPLPRTPNSGASITEAIALALRDMRALISPTSRVAVFAPGGEKVAYITPGTYTYAGNLVWEKAPMMTVAI